MSDDTRPAEGASQLDPAFFTCVNEYVELANRQVREQGDKRVSVASLYAAARFNAHTYLATVPDGGAAGERTDFLDYMTGLYRRMLNEHLDGLGRERGIDVGISELAPRPAPDAARPQDTNTGMDQ